MDLYSLQDIELTDDSNISESFQSIDLVELSKYSEDIKPKQTTIDLVGGIYCNLCEHTYCNKKEYENHYTEHGTGEKVVYTCVVCHKQLSSYASLRGHCYNHLTKERHKCEHCSKYFSKITALNDHIKALHQFKCPTCNTIFNSRSELKLHEVIHDSDSSPYKCHTCQMKLPSLESCKKHIEDHIVFIYTCPICNENIPSRENARDHLVKHFDNTKDQSTIEAIQNSESQETSVERLGGIACGYCSVVFKNRVEFDAHFSLEHGDKDIVYICIACDKEFDKYSVFGNHAYNHFTQDRYRCSLCYRTYSRLSLLATHVAACAADQAASGRPFKCSECSQSYCTEQRLRRHLQDAHAVFCLSCPVEDCQKIFASPKELILHKHVHSAQSWCRQCGLLLGSLEACERHLAVHRRTLFGCPICHKDYGERYRLEKHLTQHFQSILHICKLCGKVFNRRRNFMSHVRTHSEQQVYNCTYCTKGFNKLNHLQQHLNIHTGSTPYKCPMCSKTFTNYANWVKHKRRMHKLEAKQKTVDDEDEDEESDTEKFKAEFAKSNDKNNMNKSTLSKMDHTEIVDMKHDCTQNENNSNITKINPNGTVDMKLNYIENENNCNIAKINPNGTVDMKLNYTENENNCNIAKINPNGTVDMKLNYIENENNSNITQINPNGTVDMKLNYIENENNSNITQINPNGTVDMKLGYRNNEFEVNMEPEAIEHIDIEKELQMLENIQEKQNDNNFDEPVYILGANDAIFDNASEEVPPRSGAAPEAASYPPEYGPEFSIGDSCGILDLDDHMLPHIDPLLTIKTEEFNLAQNNALLPQNAMYQETPKWEPPIFTKVGPEYAYYGDMVDSNRLTMMNTDIF